MVDLLPDTGWCYLCNAEYQGGAAQHFEAAHPVVTGKVRAAKISWQTRLDNIQKAIEEIRAEPSTTIKVNRLDIEVIQELYLVRAKLAQMKRDKEGSDNGSS